MGGHARGLRLPGGGALPPALRRQHRRAVLHRLPADAAPDLLARRAPLRRHRRNLLRIHIREPFREGRLLDAKDDRVPGDFGWDPMDMYPTDPAARVEMQTKELNNGRVAMIAVAGMVAQELATGAKLF